MELVVAPVIDVTLLSADKLRDVSPSLTWTCHKDDWHAPDNRLLKRRCGTWRSDDGNAGVSICVNPAESPRYLALRMALKVSFLGGQVQATRQASARSGGGR